MSKRVAFIHKKTLTLTDHCAWPVIGSVSPMAEYYCVIIEAGRKVPTVDEVKAELVKLRAKYPDVTTTDEEGNTSTAYGKYSELGMCLEPWEELA